MLVLVLVPPWGGENPKGSAQSCSPSLARPWIHRALSEGLKDQHKFSFYISKCLSGINPNQAEVNTFLGNTLNVARTSLPNGAW